MERNNAVNLHQPQIGDSDRHRP